MKTRTGLIVGLAAIAAGILWGGCAILAAGQEQQRTELRVGVYDSRAIAIAYAPSKYTQNEIQKMYDIVHKAEAQGDTETAQKTRDTAEFMQKRRHLQGFGTAPVHELIEPVKDKLPKLAADCQVDAIVSKWEFDYLAPDAAVKDITHELVALFEPNARALNIIAHLKNWVPLPENEILEHPH